MTQESSSIQAIPKTENLPKHIAIIMDGNGRWAQSRFMPRISGHKQGVETVRGVIKACMERGVPYLTLFAFSSENWRRPNEEIDSLMQLFLTALEQEITKLHENGICFKVVGDLSKFDSKIIESIQIGEQLTAENNRDVNHA